MVYKPREDSFLLQRYVKKYAHNLVLDMCTGSGIQAVTAAPGSTQVIAVDIDPAAIAAVKQKAAEHKMRNITVLLSDLFVKVPQIKFDLIICNPPYLPGEREIDNISLFGGKKGYELVERFFNQAGDYLKSRGVILLVVSSLTKFAYISRIISTQLFEYKMLIKKHIFFEDIMVLEITKSSILKELHRLGISQLTYFTKGTRSFIYTGLLEKRKVAVKLAKEPEHLRQEHEAEILERINKIGIGPRLCYHDNFLIMEFIAGEYIDSYLKKHSKEKVARILKKIFLQLHELDCMGINKFEMHTPYKHIIVKEGTPVLLDFERARCTEQPKNVTQFASFLISAEISCLLSDKNIVPDRDMVISCCKKYKQTYALMHLENLMSCFQLNSR